MRGFPLRTGFLLPLLLMLAGCGSLSYYAQAVGGQMDLTARRQPVSALLAARETPADLKKKLALATALNRFAHEELQLPASGSFRSYADLERPFATWVVFATPEFSLKPLEWCFPVTGCLGYRGYFNREDAETFAAGLQPDTIDRFVTGSPAYSTLGWFEDPLLNTFIHWPEEKLAALMFHELAHEKLYVADDTAFNESYAEAVSQAGVARWLRKQGRPQTLKKFQRELKQRDAFVRWVIRTREKLKKLYASDLPPADMRIKKKNLLTRALKDPIWGEKGGEVTEEQKKKNPFSHHLNNAKLASVNTYTRWVPAFSRLLALLGGDMIAFHRAAAELANLSKTERREKLAGLSMN